MPWNNSVTAPFSRIGIVSEVPSSAGVYGIYNGELCVHVGETWNLKARLLELINSVSGEDDLSVRYEVCTESEAAQRSAQLKRELATAGSHVPPATHSLSGISFWTGDSSVPSDSGVSEV